ncbi:uncharacterized protein LOC134670532 [Cydia fagiglandana]|uniref:uncharacterized protein LOC134670532 n=1 Tax=Cydia fagiglandana TaxID=1458189 RepID=UPI002FEE32E9
MAVYRCFCSMVALMMITGSNADHDDHDRTIFDEDNNDYDDILDAVHKGKYYRNNDDNYNDDYGIFRARDDDDDGLIKLYVGRDVYYMPESALFIDNLDSDDKNGITNSDVGVYNMYRSRGRGRKPRKKELRKIDKEKLRAIITLLHHYNPLMKLFSMKNNGKKRVAWRKWLNWYDSTNSGINGMG